MTGYASRPLSPRRVTVALPAKNEEAAIGRTLRAIPRSTLGAMGYDVEVVVLDGQSRDATLEIARRWGARVVRDPEPGKGSAVRNARGGFRGEFVVMLDADGTYAADAIPRIVAPLARDEADVVMGDRVALPGSMPPINRVGNAVLSLAATVLYGRACRDVCTGLWGFRSAVLRALPLASRGFGLEAELFALTSRFRLRVSHVPVDYLPRAGQTKLHPARDGLRIARRLARSRFVALSRQQEVAAASAPSGAPAREEAPA